MNEYRVLKVLSRDDEAISLGCLPLQLVRAGTYMARFESPFIEYRNIFKNENRIEEIEDIMKDTEDMNSIRESQRSI